MSGLRVIEQAQRCCPTAFRALHRLSVINETIKEAFELGVDGYLDATERRSKALAEKVAGALRSEGEFCWASHTWSGRFPAAREGLADRGSRGRSA